MLFDSAGCRMRGWREGEQQTGVLARVCVGKLETWGLYQGCGGVIRLLELITYLSWLCADPLSACLAVVRAPSGLPHRHSMPDSVIRVSICAIDFFPFIFLEFHLTPFWPGVSEGGGVGGWGVGRWKGSEIWECLQGVEWLVYLLWTVHEQA